MDTSVQAMIVHSREFTDIEVEGLTLWNALQDRGEQQLARDLLDATLMVEHFTSLLPHLPTDRSPDQIQKQVELRAVMQQLQQQARDILSKPGMQQVTYYRPLPTVGEEQIVKG